MAHSPTESRLRRKLRVLTRSHRNLQQIYRNQKAELVAANQEITQLKSKLEVNSKPAQEASNAV